MEFESLLELAEERPDDGTLVASLLVHSAQVDMQSLPEDEQERLYNLFAYVFATVATGPHSALQAALQRALTQPFVLEYFQRRMEASAGFDDMMENNPAAPIILALLCSHDDPAIAEGAAIALSYTGSRVAYDMLQRWLNDNSNKRLSRAAELALSYYQDEPEA